MSAVTVLYVNHTPQVSGAEISLLALLSGLDPRRYRPAVVVPGAGPLVDRLRAEGMPAEVVPLERGGLRRPDQVARNLARLARVARRHRPRLVHANSFQAIRMVLPYALLARRPLLGSIRDIVPFSRWTARAIFACDRVVCVSRAAEANLVRGAGPARRARVRVIYNGVDAALFSAGRSPAEAAAALGLSHLQRPLIGIVAPLVRWKGQDLFLEAAAAVRRRTGAGSFLLAGGDSFAEPGYVDALRRRAAAADLDGHVHFLGFRERVAELLAALDVVVCASRRPDPLPRAVLEAMAAGRPVVGSAIGGVPEAVSDGDTGLLAPPDDAGALADRIVELLADEPRRLEMGRRAARRARQRFSLSAHCGQMMATYDELLGR